MTTNSKGTYIVMYYILHIESPYPCKNSDEVPAPVSKFGSTFKDLKILKKKHPTLGSVPMFDTRTRVRVT